LIYNESKDAYINLYHNYSFDWFVSQTRLENEKTAI